VAHICEHAMSHQLPLRQEISRLSEELLAFQRLCSKQYASLLIYLFLYLLSIQTAIHMTLDMSSINSCIYDII
jgi:hypothetical protein